MTRKKAKKVAKLLKAYAKGSTLQVREDAGDKWADAHDPDFLHIFQWRVKPES